MEKIKEFLNTYPAIKIFGIPGVIIILVLFVIATVFSSEVERVWNEHTHPPAKTESPINSEEPDNSSEEVQPSVVPDDENDSLDEDDGSDEDETGVLDNQTEVPEESEIPSRTTSFDGNVLNGVLVGEDVRKEIFVPKCTGVYRFDFDIDSVKKNYIFYIMDSAEEELTRNYYSDSDPAGTSVTLEGGREYTLVVEHQETEEYDDVEYTININLPDEVMSVEGNKIAGQVRYIDQQIEYRYIAPRTGIFRFDFDIDNVNLNYGFYIYDEKEDELVNTDFNSEGATYELVEGKQYRVLITQKEGVPHYIISIGVPDREKKVNGNTIKGTIRYIDQVNKYYYIAPETGTYKIKLGINDVNKGYKLLLLSKKKEELIDTLSSYDETTVELKKGEKYEIQIEEYSGPVKYNVKISLSN